MSQYADYSNNPYYQSGGGGGGGGYLAGGSPFGGSNGSPGGNFKRGASHSLRPVTIKQLTGASQAHSDADWMIEDAEVAQVTIVAQVITIQHQATNVVYWLDDGTGRMEARHWVDAAVEDGDTDKWGAISENMYIRATGGLKAFGNKRYINATHLRPCVDSNEIMAHILQVFYVTTLFQKGARPPRPSELGQGGTISTIVSGTAGGPSAYSVQAHNAAVVDHYSSLQPLHRQIVNFILSQPHNEEGVHVAAIARNVGGEAHAISAALDNLMDDGHVFSTIDESHFNVSV